MTSSIRKQSIIFHLITLLLYLTVILGCRYWTGKELYLLTPEVTLGVFLILLLNQLLGRRFSDPLAQLNAKAQSILDGVYSGKLRIDSSMELKQLADSLNLLADKWEETVDKLTRERNTQEAILGGMAEGVMAIDNQENILTVNQAARRTLSMTGDEQRGKHLLEVVRVSDLQAFLHKTLISDQPQQMDFKLYIPEERFLKINGATLKDRQGKKMGVLAVINDMTQIHRLDETRKKFVADVSHELKTPISNILLVLETLEDEELDNRQQLKHFLKIIGNNTERLRLLIEDLLTLSRMESNGQKIALKSLPIIPVIQKSVANYQLAAQEKKIELKVDLPATSLNVLGNEKLLESAVNNLLDNAIKYNDEGGRVEISAQVEDKQIKITVKDTGIGIPAEDLPRIFERFYRVEKGRSRQMGGTGLGLAIVKHVALTHNGRVEAESKLNCGTVFNLYLPLEQ